MKNILFLLFACLSAGFAWGEPTTAPYLPAQKTLAQEINAPITVQFPHENMALPAGAQNTFIFGQVTLPDAFYLSINDQEVPLGINGTFLAFVPVQTGPFEFLLTTSNGIEMAQAVRHVRIPGKNIVELTAKAAFDETNVFPQHEAELLPGDTVNLFARATPNATVEAFLPSLTNGKNIPMKEDATNPGMYRAEFTIDPAQKGKTSKVVYKLTNGPHKGKAKITAPAKLTVRKEGAFVEYKQVLQDGIKLRRLPTAQGNLFPQYRAYGVVRTDGKMNNQYRVRLTDTQRAWLEAEKFAPADKPESNRITGLATTAQDTKTRLILATTRPTPFAIEEFKDRLELTLYDITAVEDSFSMDNTSPLLERVAVSQPETGTFRLTLYFKPTTRLWGYTYGFENGQLYVDLNHTPDFKPTSQKPLKGVRILVDAGHNPKNTPPYDGAVGPTGYLEYEATLSLAYDLKKALEKKGATVILTRQGKNNFSLLERYKRAANEKVHLFISLHYNALPETANPLSKPRGFSVYYAYPHSFDLALALHNAYVKQVPLADNGMIFNEVLFIPRISDFPSILVENAYLMFGDQEEMARTPQGRAHFVNALQTGIIEFVKQVNAGK